DWYNSTGFIDQSEARATGQAPSIRVHHAGHAAHYILHLIHVLLWLAAFLSRMPLNRRETQDWLRPEQVLLTNYKPELCARRCLSESTTLATPLIVCCSSFVSISGWLLIFLACN
uniref:Anoctamin n=1 Tax=Mesocestoides corti TaxID=53468 RepID=A0A5K3EW81_MESCO